MFPSTFAGDYLVISVVRFGVKVVLKTPKASKRS